MKRTVFVHANDRQMLGARISAHSYRRNAREPGSFDVKILDVYSRLAQCCGDIRKHAGPVRNWNLYFHKIQRVDARLCGN